MGYVKTLYDPGMIVGDLRCRSLSALARGLFAVLQAVCNESGGDLRIGGRGVSPAAAAAACGFDGDADALAAELVEMGLLLEDESGWFMPDQRAAADLRAKRARAGRKGGCASQGVALTPAVVRGARQNGERQNGARAVCSSNVISFEESAASVAAAKKEKRTKKEKNNNYIYILGTKVFVGDAGSVDNPHWFDYRSIRLCRRAFEALGAEFGLGADALREILEKQADWLEGQEPSYRARWLGVTLRHLQNVTGKAAGEKITA